MNDDKENLLDPTNPHSPYNRYNWDSPYSIDNPKSSYYTGGDQADLWFIILGWLVIGGFYVYGRFFVS